MTDPFLVSARKGKPFQRSASSLLGPADPDHFRIKVGRYGDRWYCDPLDADDAWTAWEGHVPSISTVKKASGQDWSFVALKRVCEALEERPDRLAKMSYAERYEALKTINKLGLDAAATRGTAVHLYAEAKLHGSEWRIPAGQPGHEYMGAVDAWFDQHQPELVAAEYVVVKRELDGRIGYGGTPDALLRIAGLLWAIDWKSRGDESDHGAYPEEAEQVAAGVMADYMIVQGDHGAERRPIPEVAGGLIVSVRPDGARSYPIDIAAAWSNWKARHAWWTARQDERKPVGKPWPITKPRPPEAPPAPVLGARAANLLDRCKTIQQINPAAADNLRRNWPTGVAKLSEGGHDEDDLDRIEWIVGTIEAEIGAPLAPISQEMMKRSAVRARETTKVQVPDVDEGNPATPQQMLELRLAYDRLDDAGRSWIAQLTTEARDAGAPFHPSERKTLRTVRIVSGLIILAAAEADDADVVRALVCAAIGDDVALQPALPLGAVVAMMGAAEAALFAGLADALAVGRLQFSFDDGVMRVVDRVLSTDEVADLFGAVAV